ncbi:acyltransferase family protein [uncultured Bacteroides sp.]|uniref:acyltransferase family protein n=1 Tax=uncultured Bacteroides sp. TaxID=162156 RepID=UPI002AA83E31|nr:acyltransferase family protein [uncultured Bacteroides sp.]
MKNRILELDFLKCVFIVLMIMFHLSYFGDKHPLVKQFVYTFHMPAFLLISGYLANIHKNRKQFFRGILWIFIPYSFMEIGYVIMASILPIREHLDDLSIILLLKKVIKEPMGPYWYLHTLIICEISYYVVFQLKKLNTITKFIVLGTLLYLLSHRNINLLVFANAIYFLIGTIIRQSDLPFLSIFKSTLWTVIPLTILSYYPQNLDRGTLAGLTITFLVINLLLAIHHYVSQRIKWIIYYIGRNTLVIFLFSPIFTILAKTFIPLFLFDPTGICFACAATAFAFTGCFAIAYAMDYFKLSRFFFGKERILK